MCEIWKDISGFEGLYQVSNMGDIKRIRRSFSNGKVLPEIIRKQVATTGGYLKIGLTKGKKQYTLLVHRIVAFEFIPNPKHKAEVNHKNGDKTDNRACNLEWNTPLENTRHSNKNGLVNIKGSNNCRSKLKEEDITDIRYLLVKGLNSREISELYNVSRSTINSIKLNKTWKHII